MLGTGEPAVLGAHEPMGGSALNDLRILEELGPTDSWIKLKKSCGTTYRHEFLATIVLMSELEPRMRLVKVLCSSQSSQKLRRRRAAQTGSLCAQDLMRVLATWWFLWNSFLHPKTVQLDHAEVMQTCEG